MPAVHTNRNVVFQVAADSHWLPVRGGGDEQLRRQQTGGGYGEIMSDGTGEMLYYSVCKFVSRKFGEIISFLNYSKYLEI